MTRIHCKDCAYVDIYDSDRGTCHYAPPVVSDPESGTWEEIWPGVSLREGWCGKGVRSHPSPTFLADTDSNAKENE